MYGYDIDVNRIIKLLKSRIKALEELKEEAPILAETLKADEDLEGYKELLERWKKYLD